MKKTSTNAKKVCGFLSCFSFSRLGSRHGIAHNIRDINIRLDEIAASRNRYHLESREINQHNSTWRETSSFIEESHILGREVEKSIILRYLGVNNIGCSGADAAAERIQTISLVGMGGLGKTALAQLVFNDDFVKKHFDEENMVWVCVSDIFDEKKVAKATIQSLEKISSFAANGLETEIWQVLLERVSESIKGKKFFLVFDDIWGENSEKWEELKTCFKQGARGSRILVTTRIVSVATMMGSSPSQIIQLEKLGDEACWSILEQRALRGRRDSASLEEIGRKIAARCKGLPLAAKTLGSLLKTKSSRKEWESVMKSEIWELDLAQKDIFAPLLLSYNDLPPVLRRCFVSCIIYPKDQLLGVVDLIYQWMCRGYLGFDNDADMESTGRNYFDILANRSLFQDFTVNEDEIIQSCKMHDVVHDFVKYLVENEFVTKEVQPGDRNDPNQKSINLEKCRHLTVMLNESGSFASVSISGAKKLHSLAVFAQTSKAPPILESLPSLLEQSKRLRLLDLSEAHDYHGRVIPNGIGGLIHLRWLSLHHTPIKQLPEALSSLRNLIVLDLSYCRQLEELPVWIAKFINLRVLLTFDCEGLSKYPKEVRELTRLRYLLGAIVRADGDYLQEFCIGDLGKLKHVIWVNLILKGSRIDVEEARNAQLDQLMDLEKLFVSWKRSIKKEEICGAMNLPSGVLEFENQDDD